MREAENRDRQDNRDLLVPDGDSPRIEDRPQPLGSCEGYSIDILEAIEG